MPRNGTGTYVLPVGQPVVPATTVSSSVFNSLVADLSAEVTRSVSTDGQTPMAASLNLGGFRITNLGTATQPSDAARLDQVASLINLGASNGASLIGGGGQVVSSITSLRTLLISSASKNAFVTGYYMAGDGGGGPYYLDITDTTSVDNAGTIIVANDGGRWKYAGLGDVNIPIFGATADGATDDGPAFNRTILEVAKRGGGVVRGKVGTSKIVTSILVPTNVKLDLLGCTLIGNGSNILIRSGALVGGALIDITVEDGTAGTGSGTHFCSNTQIVGGTLANAACGIRAHRFNYGSTIEHVVFSASLTNSYISSHSWGLKVHQNTIYSPSIMRDFVDWTEVSGNSWEGPSVTAGTTALTITTNGYGGSYSARFISNGFHHWTNGIVFSTEATNAVIESNHFEDTKFHVSGNGLTCRNFRIRNNWMKANLSPSGGGVIAIAFQALWDSEIGPNIYTSDGVSTFNAYVAVNTASCFGNKVVLPYAPSGAIDLSMYQLNDCTTIEVRGGTNDLTKTQPSVENVTGSGYTIEKYKSRYHNIANTIPFCTVNYSGTTATIDTWIASDAYGTEKECAFNFICPGSFTWMLSGRFNRLNPVFTVALEKYAGSAFTGAMNLTNNGGFLRITITGLSSGGNISGWVKEL